MPKMASTVGGSASGGGSEEEAEDEDGMVGARLETRRVTSGSECAASQGSKMMEGAVPLWRQEE